MLKAENVTVRYGARTVVQDLSFELKAGEWLSGGHLYKKMSVIEKMRKRDQ